MGTLGGVAMDKAGQLPTPTSFDISGAVGLSVYTGCTGTGTELTSANGFTPPYYGGVGVDDRGDLVVVSLLNSTGTSPSTVTVYLGLQHGVVHDRRRPVQPFKASRSSGTSDDRDERWATFPM